MSIQIRDATPSDVSAILALMPRLANFELPKKRMAAHLWEGDADLLRRWADGKEPTCFVHVAVDRAGGSAIIGASLTTLREELLSHEPSAHLEVLVVAEGAEGQGLGRRMVDAAEQTAKAKGAKSMTLHVFGNNVRARGLYQRLGFEEELLRCIKHFED